MLLFRVGKNRTRTMTTTETLAAFCAIAMMVCVIILVRSIFTLRNIDKGLSNIVADTLDNMAQIKRLQVELESLKEANRRLVNGKKGNEAECVHPGRPDVQRCMGNSQTGSPQGKKSRTTETLYHLARHPKRSTIPLSLFSTIRQKRRKT